MMRIPKRLTSAALVGLAVLAVSYSRADSGIFQSAVSTSQLDPAALVQWVDGSEQPLKNADGSPALLGEIVVTPETKKLKALSFGKSATPGPRHVRIGFLEPVKAGTILAVGDVSVSILKPDASYPGNPGDDSQWIPLQRLANGELTKAPTTDYQCAAWLLPPGTQVRALRFTHEAGMLDSDFSGRLRAVQVFKERFVNVAARATATAAVSRQIEKINNEDYDGWNSWENLDGKEGNRSRTVAEDPEWLILTWPEPVTLRGMAFWWAGFGAGEVQAYVGPADVHPKSAAERDWQSVETLEGVKNGYPSNIFALHWVDFGRDVTTRALRLRITGVSDQPKDRDRDGKRVWLGEWMAFSVLGNQPAESVIAASVKQAGLQEKAGVIPIRFSLPEPGFVTLVIDDMNGLRVRNLISETPFGAGDHTVWWDGSDDLGRDVKASRSGIYQIPFQLVAPGEYHVHGLWRKDVSAVYEFSVYLPGNPPWSTDDHTGAWLANHSPPQSAVFVPGGERSPTGEPLVYLGCIVTEGPDAVAWVDLEGRKRGGRKWIGGTWTGAPFMAFDAGSKADPAVSVYVGTGWKDDKTENSSLLRLNTLTPLGDSKPVLNVDLGKLVEGTKMTESLAGLSARDSVLVCSLIHRNELLFVDATPGGPAKESGRLPVESPRGSAFDANGRFYVLSGTSLLRYPAFPSAESKPETLDAKGLEDPQGLALDAAGNLYISDWGTSHQVKVFSADGKFLRAIGDPGKPQAGRYNANHMNHPWGIAVDSQNRLWVAEHDQLPRRVSVWSLDGKLLNAFYGPGKYGGGGVVDSQDRNRFYYAEEHSGSMEFRLDWEKGSANLHSVFYRPTEGKDLKLPKQASGPEQPIDFQGRRYFTNVFNSNPVGGTTEGFLFQERDGIARPVAAMGWAMWWDLLKEDAFRSRWPEGVKVSKTGEIPTSLFYYWSDANGDALVQPEEVEMQNIETRGITILPDLSFCIANRDGKAVRFIPAGFDKRGVPRYDLSKGQVLADNVKPPASSGGAQVLTDESGWTALTLGSGPFDAHSLSGAKDGKPRWSYPSPWPGLHAGQKAPRHSLPGQVIGSTRLLGGLFNVGKETLWAVNSDQGGPYVFTRDGLFVATLFKGVGVGNSWRMPKSERGMKLKGLTLGQENFWPTISRTSDNKVWLMDGSRMAIVRLDGLDTIRRLDLGKVKVTENDLVRTQELLERREAERQKEQGSGVLKVSRMSSEPNLDGKLDDWSGASWVEIDRRGRENIHGAVAIAGDRLLAAWQTGDAKLLANSGENPLAPFKTGGALDLMIGVDPKADPKRKQPVPGDLRLLVTQVKGKTKAMLYRAVVPGTKEQEKVPFSSPWRTIYFDQVSDFSDRVVLAADKDGTFEISVPLDALGWNPSPGTKIRGDIGILRGDGSETTARIYWSNKGSGIVTDVPAEAQLTPALWGIWEIGETR